MDDIKTLRAAAHAAILARDAIESCCSPEWKAAHQKARVACLAANAERDRLAKNPATRYGAWRAPSDVALMNCGAL